MKRLNTRGQLLVEMIVVIGVVVVLATGIVVGTTVALSGAQQNSLRSGATQYAQEGIELARDKRDAGWNAFADLGTPKTIYCVGTNKLFNETSGGCAPNIGDQYTRKITLELIDPGSPTQVKMSVDVTVAWGDQTDANTVELTTDLTQWK